ncbi:Chromodomain-helicase-DNA-binding protein 8 [Nibea albiflora]|uniref:Chromodomain-helicase-DNA-binding protein 8 n=1 Tax=Nibea albiflora TaxID=240163 RepID=A0ACB7FI06_NIBAL|nr:Chromodomain-helicase-DNA-binding protein 8 [Nibea albiflora]
MCRRVCHLRTGHIEDPSELSQTVAPITEERASRTLYRISLLRRLRERVLPHPSLEERLALAPTSSELPTWWNIPDHDRQLMLGASLHGVSRTELSIFSDPQFTFSQAREEFIQNQQAPPPPPPPQAPLIMPLSLLKTERDMSGVKEEGAEEDGRLLGGQIGGDLQGTPLSHHDGKARGQGWSMKRSRERVGKTGGGRKGEGGSDSDSDSDSGSSSSERSGSSDESGESEEEGTMKMCDVDEDNSLLSMTTSQDGLPPPDPLRVDWPKDRVLINRLDSLCTLVLTGQWPSGRRYVSEAHLNPSSELTGDEMAYTRVIRKPGIMPGGPGAEGDDGEFTVKLLKEEGLKLTFSKQALMPNGSAGESSRKKRKDQELSDPDGLDPLERTPRRRDPPTWLKENPDYEVEGDMLELLVNRSKRKRRRRADKALTGSEKVKVINMRTGKKVGAAFCPMLQDLREYLEENPDNAVAPDWSETVRNSGFLPETFFHRLLTEHSEIPKKSRRRHHHHHHHHHHHTPDPTPEEPTIVEEETLVSDGAYMMDEEDLETSHHFLTSADFDVKMEGGDSLSQGDYDSSDQEALLEDVIIAQKDSDSSSSSED